MVCVYTLQDPNGKSFQIEGRPALMAYFAEGGLEAQFPERQLPRSVAEILGREPAQYSIDERSAGKRLYHVTTDNNLPSIIKKGIIASKTKGASRSVGGGLLSEKGKVYAFDNFDDAARFASRFTWDGTKASIIAFDDNINEYEKDTHFESSGAKGNWLKKTGNIPLENIAKIFPVTPEMTRAIVQSLGTNTVVSEDQFEPSKILGREPDRRTEQLPEKINIDGVDRWTVNSEGKPIAQTEEQVRNFWRWFGDSKVVDAQGRPRVVYHGTKDDFAVFDFNHPNRKDSGWLGTGVYLSSDVGTAGAYAKFNKEGKGLPRVMDLYARLENPYFANIQEKNRLQNISNRRGKEEGRKAADAWTEELKVQGYDGVILEYQAENVGVKLAGTQELVVFDNTGVKSATGNTGEFNPENPDIRYAFAGQKAQTADLHALSTAQDRIANGEDPEIVRQETGWYRGEDGIMRYEITDHQAKLKLPWINAVSRFEKAHKHATVGDILDHPRLFAAYPELANYQLTFRPSKWIGGMGGIIGKHIYLASNQSQAEMKSVLMHELQHAIQKYEGFAAGGTPNSIDEGSYQEYQREMLHALEDNISRLKQQGNLKLAKKAEKQYLTIKQAADFKAYKRLAGEVEAVNVQSRLHMNEAQRRKVSPFKTAAYKGADVIVRFNDTDMASALPPANMQSSDRAERYFDSAASALGHLKNSFGVGVETLLNNGMLNLTYGQSAWPQEARHASAEAVYVGRLGKAFIDLNVVGKNRLDAAMLHELGEHFGLMRMLGTDAYNSLLNSIRARAKIKGSMAEKVWGEVKAAYPHLAEDSDAFVAEVIAKLGERNPKAPWYRRLLAQIKSFLMRMGLARGIVAGTITEDDLHQLLITSLRSTIAKAQRGDYLRVSGYVGRKEEPEPPLYTSGIGEAQYSIPSNPINQVPDSEYDEAEDAWLNRAMNKWWGLKTTYRHNRNAVFNVHQLIELGQYVMPGLKEYAEKTFAHEGVVAEWMQKGDKLVSETWRKLANPERHALSYLKHNSTLADVDASKDWRFVEELKGGAVTQYRAVTQAALNLNTQKALNKAAASSGAVATSKNSATFNTEAEAQAFLRQLEGLENKQRNTQLKTATTKGQVYYDRNGERHRILDGLRVKYDSISDKAKHVYNESNKIHNELFEEWFRSIEDRIEQSELNQETRRKVINEMRHEFEAKRLNWYYSPLKRFGDYWFAGTTSEGDPFFETAESPEALAKKKERFIEQGGTYSHEGQNLSDAAKLYSAQADSNLVNNIELELNKYRAPGTPEALVEAVTDIQKEIHQIFLATLPQVSVRHNHMTRTGTLGFDADSMRAFSDTLHHSATQLANLKYSHEMKRVLDEHNEGRSTASSPKARDIRETKLKALQILRDDWDTWSNPDTIQEALTQARADGDEDAVKFYKEMATQLAALGKIDNEDTAQDSLNLMIAKTERILKIADGILQKDLFKATDLLTELNKSYQAAVNPISSDMERLATKFNSLNFTMMLALSLSAGIVNMVQTPGVAMPVAIGRHEVGRVMVEFGRTFKEFMEAVMYRKADDEGNYSITEVLREQYEKARAEGNDALAMELDDDIRALEFFKKDGTISATQIHDIMGVAQEGHNYGSMFSNINRWAGFLFHHSERANREMTLLAAYRLEKARLTQEAQKARAEGGKALSAKEIKKQSLDYARYLTNRAHFDYNPKTAARIFRGTLAKFMMQFKKYPQGMLFVYGKAAVDAFHDVKRENYATQELFEKAQAEKREAFRTLIGLLTMQVSLAGVTSLPLMGALGVVYSLIGAAVDDPDDPWDLDRDLRLGLAKFLPEHMAEAMAKGVINSLTPINLSSRLDQSDIFFREPMKELEGRDAAQHYVTQLLGPTAGTFAKAFEGMKFAADGQPMRAAEQFMPKAIGDVIKTIRYGMEDARSIRGDIVKEMSPDELFWQLLGFSSSELERAYAERQYAKGRELAIHEEHQALVNMAVDARLRGEPVDREALNEWNVRHPEYPIHIRNILASLRSKRESLRRRGERGYSVNPKLEYLYEENAIMD